MRVLVINSVVLPPQHNFIGRVLLTLLHLVSKLASMDAISEGWDSPWVPAVISHRFGSHLLVIDSPLRAIAHLEFIQVHWSYLLASSRWVLLRSHQLLGQSLRVKDSSSHSDALGVSQPFLGRVCAVNEFLLNWVVLLKLIFFLRFVSREFFVGQKLLGVKGISILFESWLALMALDNPLVVLRKSVWINIWCI